jgi:hypothetical protein
LAKIILQQIKTLNDDEEFDLNDIAIDLDIEDEGKSARQVAMEIFKLVFSTDDPQNTARGILSKKVPKDVVPKSRKLDVMTTKLKRANRRDYPNLTGSFEVRQNTKLKAYDISVSQSKFEELTRFIDRTNSNRCFIELERPDLKITAYARVIGSTDDENENLIFVSSFFMDYFKNPKRLNLYGMCDMQEIALINFNLYDAADGDNLSEEDIRSEIELLMEDMPAISVGQEFTFSKKASVTIQIKEIFVEDGTSVFAASVPIRTDNLKYNVVKVQSQIACNYCEKMTAIGQCCRKVHYCGEACQKKDWKNHIKECMRIQF